MENVCSLLNKIDELMHWPGFSRILVSVASCVVRRHGWTNWHRTQWLPWMDLDSSRWTWDAKSGKQKGGWLTEFVNERWCNPAHVSLKEQLCTKDIRLLAVGIQPYYIPREFSHVVVFSVCYPSLSWCNSCVWATAWHSDSHAAPASTSQWDIHNASLFSTLSTFT